MVKPARERIAALLRGGEPTGSFSAETSAPMAGATLSVDGVGRVKLPVGAPEERKLVSVARQAMFGLGEQTLTDTSVRDTWEVTAPQVSLGGAWDQVLAEALVEIHEGLGLPTGARLRAELHALLVYGPDQEKDDEMVATLVVSLPSVHTGGELVVSHGGQTRTYRHDDRGRIGFVAFYADCFHEVRPVRTGRRVTLTFNVMVVRDSQQPDPEPDELLASLVGEHFTTPVPRSWGTGPTPTPDRLVVLLDHEYSQRGLTAGRLKGRDVLWVSRLRAAAVECGCVSALALAEIQQTWSVTEDDRSWRSWDDEEYDEEPEASDEVGDLIEDAITLGWWKREGVSRGERIRLSVGDSEVCAVTPTESLTPYESEYEGYMGNYGNTVDRWYRRAAILLWPKARDFMVRAEADLTTAIAELDARLGDGKDLDSARVDARGLVPLMRTHSAGQLGPVLSVALALDDAELANALLSPLGGEALAAEDASPLAAVADRYGNAWTGSLIESWFPVGGYRHGRNEWVSGSLADLASALRQAGAATIADLVCRRMWAHVLVSVTAALKEGPRSRARSMQSLADPAQALFRAADANLVEEFVASLAQCGDGVLDLELPLARMLAEQAHRSLTGDAARRLEARLAAPPREADDWSIEWHGCGCDLCETLQGFLADRTATLLDWPLRTDRRRHIHQHIDTAELPVAHHTIRKGSPYTLHLVKQPDLHERDAAQRREAAADLMWLRG